MPFLAAQTTSVHGLPRILGVLMTLGWLTFLSPPLGAKYLYPYILVAAIGEGLLTLWLLVMGVNEQRWKEQASPGLSGGRNVTQFKMGDDFHWGCQSMPKRDDSSTRSWEAVAEDWVAHADTNDYRNCFLLPRMLQMIGDVGGRRALDLGCGEGGYSRELARRGAQVMGVDGSARLVEVARDRALAENLDISYVCANASALDSIAPASFDLVLAAMSLMDVEDYAGAIRETHRVLISGGELLMSITHPCFSAPVSEWVRDGAGRPRFFAVDRYFERLAWEDLITPAFRSPVIRRHRPLEDYIAAPLHVGFVLREFREPSVTEQDLKKSARFAYLTRIPYFLFMRWQKP